MDLKPHIHENGIDYVLCGDYYIPLLELPAPMRPIGLYGRMRKAYLQDHHPILFQHYVLTGTLYEHCAEIDAAARQRLDLMLPELAKSAGATEKLKASDPMRWVGLMNAFKAQVEEIIKYELIYV